MTNLISEHIDIWMSAQTPKSSGRGNGTAYGIKKLRELILELAVSGRLVPQDPNDLPAPRPGVWFVYVLECEDGSYYKGYTQDILERWKQHARGTGAEWTDKHPPKRLVHWEEFSSESAAVAREKELKTGFGRKWLEREIKASRTRQAGEPAGVLFEKITKEKARLIKEGKIKKEKPLPEIGEDEKPFELPRGWEWARLGDITNYGMSDKVDPGNADDDTWILELEDVEKGTSRLLQKVRCADREFRSSKSRFYKGYVIYGKLRPYLDKVIVADEDGLCTTEMIPLKGYDCISPYFLRLVMKSPYFIHYADESTHGMNLPRLGTDKARLALFPVVSLAEQHRIVAKVDELMALCDQLEQQQNENNSIHLTLVETLLGTLTETANHKELESAWQHIADNFDTLFTTEESIDLLKKTILQLAVMGKLVPQDPNDLPEPRPGVWFVYVLECEDGSYYKGYTQDILERWKQHARGTGAEWTDKHPPKRLVHWEEFSSESTAVAREKELKTGFGRTWLEREIKASRTRQAGEPASVLLEKIAKEKARLIKEGKIKKENPSSDNNDSEEPFTLPLGWEWCTLSDVLALVTDGDHQAPPKSASGVPFLVIGNLRSSKIVFDNCNYVPEEYYHNLDWGRQPVEGDILYTVTGSYGITIPVDSNESFCVQRHVAILKSTNATPRKYLSLMLRSAYSFTYITRIATGIAQKTVPLTGLRKMPIALPPVSEQHRIVTKVDELMALCDTLKARLTEAQTTQVQLADSIVAQAVA